MYKFLFLLAGMAAITTASCQSPTLKKAKDVQAAIDKTTAGDRTSDNGFYLKAVIDGKQWAATTMTIDKDNSNIVQVHGNDGKTAMEFNLYKPAAGKEKGFSVSSPATWLDNSDADVYTGDKGSAVITKMDDQWIEGSFSFTAHSGNKTATVTNGRFRIPNPKQFN